MMVSMPSLSGMKRSVTTTSAGRDRCIDRAASPSAATATSKPSAWSNAWMVVLRSSLSSTTRMCFLATAIRRILRGIVLALNARMANGKETYKVGITGSYGGLNLGDEAILQSIVTQLRRDLPVEITVFSRDAEDTKRRHGI